MNTLTYNAGYLAPADNLIVLPMAQKKPKYTRTASPFKSNGQPKATPADPIRTVEEIHTMQQYFLDKGQLRNYLLMTFGISFAIRASDLLELTFAEFYEADGTVREYFTIYEKKTRKRNKIHINSKCREILQQYYGQLKTKPAPTDSLFISRQKDTDGKPKRLTIQQLNNILKKAAKECGVKGHISSHSLRKTFAYHTIKINNGSQDALLALQYMYNHESIKTTFRYCGIEDDKVAAMRDDIGNLLI